MSLEPLKRIYRRSPIAQRAWRRTFRTVVGGRALVTGLPARVAVRYPRTDATFIRLQLANRFSRRSLVVSDGRMTISTTTYGARVSSVHIALESIAAGTMRPRRVVLWLDDPQLFGRLPRGLRRLRRRGLEIKLTETYGVHTKYYPYVLSREHHDEAVATCDDDLIYPRSWLAGLIAAYDEDPHATVSYRCHRMTMTPTAIAPYRSWPRCESVQESLLNFSTGVSGHVLPPALLNALRARGEEFRSKTPRNDDVWMHATAVRHGIVTRQVADHPQLFPFIPGSQDVTLNEFNVLGGENDIQIAASYSESDIARLQAAAGL